MLKLSSPVTDVSGIGSAKSQALVKLGVEHVRDMIFAFPRRYEDFSQVTDIKDLEVGEQMTVHGRVTKVNSKPGYQGRRRLLRIFVEIEDDTGALQITWFNLRFLEQKLKVGTEIFLAGTVEKYSGKKQYSTAKYAMRSPAMEFPNNDPERTHTAAITPIYSETRGISSRFFRYQVKKLLPIAGAVPEYIPKKIIERNNLMSIHSALKAIHFPQSQEELEEAKKRMRFDELFFLQLAALTRRRNIKKQKTKPITISKNILSNYKKKLPFKLTDAQQIALEEILKDMGKTSPMNRLLQGDVGSGKSAVALLAGQAAIHKKRKVLYLAPTEILARQQATYFEQNMDKDSVHLLVGSLKKRQKDEIKIALQSKKPCTVIGTHALLQQGISSEGVGLVIIDEQHRFGVAQRQALKKVQKKDTPHLLSMTATPIPRTLNLTVFGDLDVSVLDELPSGRQPITTSIVSPDNREEALISTLDELHKGSQAFVVAPLVEKSDKLEIKSATETADEMKKMLPGIAIGLVHGQMKSEEKDSVMRNFKAGAIQMLVATAVVEVGVDVPNATIMIIEGAERFGLAQLHQFRGRIGRGEKKSHCFLFPTTEKATYNERLKVLSRTQDGFIIAEEDLRLRGPGEMYGKDQSGFGNLKVASLLDYETIKIARKEAETILKRDPDLNNYPILQKKVEQKNTITHFE